MFEAIIILGIEVLTIIFIFIKLIQSISEMGKDVRRHS